MNRSPLSDDADRGASANSRWLTTSPSRLADEAEPLRRPSYPGRRRPQFPALTDRAHVWLARIPPQYQPLATARRHPHIINALVDLWGTPDQLPGYFSELMMSKRPDREGLAFEVLSEMADLMGYLDKLRRGQRA